MFSVSIALLIYGFLYFSVFGVYGVKDIPRSIGILQPMLLFFAVISSRLFIKYILAGNYLVKDKLDTIEIEKSPFCRVNSDCWDVKLKFFDPERGLRAKKVYLFTIDVSYIIPVTLGQVRSWSVPK